AWVQCETLLLQLAKKQQTYSAYTLQVIDECAQMCLGMSYALQYQLSIQNKVALLCLGLCEECAEICERYNNRLFTRCAAACRQCSSSIGSVAQAAL
ncbi:MAG: hypothetical protein M3342_06480, partial [Bacteroidota bacterium]|nr:hypothetical protein [Bacteroidota bacterium]